MSAYLIAIKARIEKPILKESLFYTGFLNIFKGMYRKTI